MLEPKNEGLVQMISLFKHVISSFHVNFPGLADPCKPLQQALLALAGRSSCLQNHPEMCAKLAQKESGNIETLDSTEEYKHIL